MVDPKGSTQQKSQTQAPAKGTSAKVAPISDSTPLHDKIRSRAHELYVGRGREPGKEQQDWLQAEHETLNPRR